MLREGDGARMCAWGRLEREGATGEGDGECIHPEHVRLKIWDNFARDTCLCFDRATGPHTITRFVAWRAQVRYTTLSAVPESCWQWAAGLPCSTDSHATAAWVLPPPPPLYVA